MKKDALMSKKVKVIIASAMAMVMAIPSMALFNKVDVKADDVELPSPIAVYDFEDLATEGVELVNNEVKPDVKDDEERAGKVLELKDSIATNGDSVSYTNSEATVKNPYKGLDKLLEEPTFAGNGENNYPIWEKGVTISYWQKAASTDSSTISFTNVRENVVHKDEFDCMNLYELCKSGLREDLFTLGEKDTLTYDKKNMKYPNENGREVEIKFEGTVEVGKTYTIYKDCGPYVRFNPEFKDTDEEGNKIYYFISNWGYDNNLKKDSILSYSMGAFEPPISKDKCTGLGEEGSEIRYAPKAIGGLQLNASGSWTFNECCSDVPMMKGVTSISEDSPQRANYAVANSYIMDGEQKIYQKEALVSKAAEWHYITRVIKNDCIITYVDGVEKDREIYSYDTSCPYVFSNKSFNLGWGYNSSASDADEPIILRASGGKSIFRIDANYHYDGKEGISKVGLGYNGNTNGITIMEMLVNDGTTLSFGGHAPGSEIAAGGDYIGTSAGTSLDNIAFYDVPFTAEEAKALYEIAKTKNIEPAPSVNPEPSESADPDPSDSAAPEPSGSVAPKPSDSAAPKPSDSAAPKPSESTGSAVEEMLGDVDGNKEVNLTDAQLALKQALDLIALKPEQIKRADVDKDTNVTLQDAQLILKYALDLIDKFD